MRYARVRALALTAIALSVLAPSPARAHAWLVQSSPSSGAVVDSISSVRLQFNEEVVPGLCHVSVVDPNGVSVDLSVNGDPQDVRAIVAVVSARSAGRYVILWHAVSADGHPVSGSYHFDVRNNGAPVALVTKPVVPRTDVVDNSEREQALPFAELTRGIGLGGLLALTGLLVFAMGHAGHREEYRSAEKALAAFAAAGLGIHLFFWDRYVMPGGSFAESHWLELMATAPGRMEVARLIFTLIAALLVFANLRPLLVLAVASLAVLVSGAIGHPISTAPLILIPLTVIHLSAVSLWLGGIISLVAVRKCEKAAYLAHAGLVSRVAFLAFFIVAISGALQTTLLLSSVRELWTTSYGLLLVAKIAGLFLLGLFGGFHRYRSIPALPQSGEAGMTLSLRYEAAVMLVVIVVATFLSYTPLPR